MKTNVGKTGFFLLGDASIDEASEYVQAYLAQLNVSSKEITRCRLSVEEVMGAWQSGLGTEQHCRIICGKRFSHISVRLSSTGNQVDPYQSEEEDTDFAGEHSLLARMGLSGSYSYINGTNEVILSPAAKSQNPIVSVSISVGLAIAVGILFTFLPETTRLIVSENIVTPFFNTLLNLLSAIATPMIFLAVYSGICNIGDMALLGNVGKKLISRFVSMTFAVLLGTLVFTIWFFPVNLMADSTGGGNGVLAIYQLLLNIVPKDIVSPFIEGNALQVIFMGCACGIGTLALGAKVTVLAELVEQLHSLVQLLMSAIGRFMPLFVFTCVLDLCLSGGFAQLGGVGKLVLLCLAITLLLMVYYTIIVSHRIKVSVPLLLKKLLPTFLVAVSTASSTAAFGINTQTCKDKLGISEKLVDFGVPLGQVLYMPTGAVMFLLSALCIGEMYSVVITPVWLLIAVLVSGILAIAAPPIPGGTLSCYTILFLQLGIPAQGIALAISMDLIMDFVLTAVNLFSLQTELTLIAGTMDMLDKECIRK